MARAQAFERQGSSLAFRLRRRLVKLGKKARPWTNARIAAGSKVGDPAIFPRGAFPARRGFRRSPASPRRKG